MTTFTRSSRWPQDSSLASSMENASDRVAFRKPHVTSQRPTLRPRNKLQPSHPVSKQDKLQRSSSLTSRFPEPTRNAVRCRPTVPASHAGEKELSDTDSAASLDIDRLSTHPKATLSFSSQRLLPDGVPDIDADDIHKPQLCVQYAKDIFDYLVSLEETFPVHKQYLDHHPDITADMRAILVNWLMQVHTMFQLLPETLFLTVSIVDRFLQAERVPRSKLQLVGAASMFLSAKYEEMQSPPVDDFVFVTDGAYTKADVLRMERTILVKVDWSLGRPLPIHFLRRISKAGQVDIMQHSLAKYALELSLLSYEMSWVRPSEQAAAALCLSIRLRGNCFWDPVLTHYGRYTEAQLEPTVARMAALLLDADKGRHTAPYQKFKSSRLEAVATLVASLRPILKKIAGRA